MKIEINKPVKQTASEVFNLRLMPEDKALFQQTAKELGVSMATLMIELTRQRILKAKEDESL